MYSRTVLIASVAMVTLASGVINLFSAMSLSFPRHTDLLQKGLPLEFIHLSRFLTLAIGLLLIVSSFNIYRRKKRAYQLVLFMSCLSIVFHLTKGLDYGEAFFSLVLVMVLLVARKSFTVKSSIPDFRFGMVRLAVTVVVVFIYGVVGFWFLDKREFGINFTVPDSMVRTVRFLTLQGDAELVPRTRHARWFLDSLYMITSLAFLYSLLVIFRPVRYRYVTLPREREQARAIAEHYGRHSIDYFKLWPDKSYFFNPSRSCFLAYRVGARFCRGTG